jgi:RNA-directed DNA polymerase
VKPSQTRITHTLHMAEGTPGCDCLGFQIRPYPVGKTKSGKDCRGRVHGFTTRITPSLTAMQRHVEALRKTRDRHRHAEQEALINALNPPIIGWSAY